MYKSLSTWVDMEDGHEYHEGEPFPHDGREVPADRIDSLMTAMNGTGMPLIEGTPDKVELKKKTK